MKRIQTIGLWILCVLILVSCMQSTRENMPKKQYAIAIHGGAGVISKSMPDSVKQKYETGLKEALDLGKSLLEKGKPALDVVEQVIHVLENNPLFNAGKGAVYTAKGEHELDAAIMDGKTLSTGAVAGVKTIKNPISLARKVMTETPHVLLMGAGAEEFADSQDITRVPNTYFDTDNRRKQLDRAQERSAEILKSDTYGTVGCVVLDKNGDLAAGTSTGGMTNKKFGRVGDAPIIGAGTYANNETCAVSATGTGEEFIRHTVASRIAALFEYKNYTIEKASSYVIEKVLQPGDGGVICVDKFGNIAMPFNSAGMFRGAADSEGLYEVKIWE
jgi:beta-aspartyl-peptidase (threonine type)